MAIDRRAFLIGLAGAAAMPAWASGANAAAYAACAVDSDGAAFAAGLSVYGSIAFKCPLPERGHGLCASPDGRMIAAFSRRPGRKAMVLDACTGVPIAAFDAPEDRHFYGHGFFSADGRILFATENDYEGERGVLGLYDAANGFARVGEFDTFGLDPHEAVLMAGGRTIAVANGGILTHPDFPRETLNPGSMEPCLAFLDARTGALIAKAAPASDLSSLSIRHIGEDKAGRIWFGGQYEGAPTDDVPLIGSAAPGGALAFVELGAETAGLRHYVGSVCVSRDGGLIAAASPRGNTVLILDAASGALVRRLTKPDVCGLAASDATFLSSSGTGALWLGERALAAHPGLAWDNHIARLT